MSWLVLKKCFMYILDALAGVKKDVLCEMDRLVLKKMLYVYFRCIGWCSEETQLFAPLYKLF